MPYRKRRASLRAAFGKVAWRWISRPSGSGIDQARLLWLFKGDRQIELTADAAVI
jgi:hypothetical protein